MGCAAVIYIDFLLFKWAKSLIVESIFVYNGLACATRKHQTVQMGQHSLDLSITSNRLNLAFGVWSPRVYFIVNTQSWGGME